MIARGVADDSLRVTQQTPRRHRLAGITGEPQCGPVVQAKRVVGKRGLRVALTLKG